MVRILANDGIDADAQILLEEASYEVDTNRIPQEELAQKLPEYDVIIVRSATKVRKDLIDQCPNLKIIARAGVGMDNIDVDYARSKGITVMNTPMSSSRAVAELAFAHMFTLARSLHLANREMPTKGSAEFKKLKNAYSDTGLELRGKTLGIIGFGRIGQEVARIAIALGMNVKPVDLRPNVSKIDIGVFDNADIALTVNVRSVDIDDMLQNSDFITLHVPGGEEPVIGAAEIAKMKDGVFLINTARGGVIDEQALLDALASGKVAGAALDVYVGEPAPRAELLDHPRISVSPHIGASTIEAQRNIGLELADRILAFFGDDK